MKRHAPEEASNSLEGTLFDPVRVQAETARGDGLVRMPCKVVEVLEAEHRRDEGLENAAAHADSVSPEWFERAVQAVQLVARTRQHLLSEDVRPFCREPYGVSGRVWGAVMREAAKRGLVEADGFGRANTSNRAVKVRWRSLIYTGGPA